MSTNLRTNRKLWKLIKNHPDFTALTGDTVQNKNAHFGEWTKIWFIEHAIYNVTNPPDTVHDLTIYNYIKNAD